ncbi:carbohydrate-binding module family 50 protein [Durotheca rogersii]|uniref:carbohydrate-binding module family 50 protein n=1 Tax=Durotheca rogersii TaxID=419775 RepID=UPI00221E8814|nr:carbohydrate-binding module family 50 protein [Durotheca rogersii]KAI5865101.1 carbohydrate-binding module family 50 protein [Durotheca rogersii]
MLPITTAVALVLAAAHSVFAAPVADVLVARQGYVAQCTEIYTVLAGDRCIDIIAKYGSAFTLQEFYSWNPQVNSACTNLYIGQQVCVGVGTTPTGCAAPTMPGLAAECTSCYQVVEGDTCWVVVAKTGVTLGNFYSWNPSINADCTNLLLGYNYCVGV